MPNETNTVFQWVAEGIATLSVLALGYKSWAVRWAKGSTNVSLSGAEKAVADNLKAEIVRLGDVNTILAKHVKDLQDENIQLRTEMAELKETVTALKAILGRIKRHTFCEDCPIRLMGFEAELEDR